MALQRCIVTGCNVLAKGTRCPEHQRSRAKDRNATKGKAYRTAEYRAARKLYKSGVFACHICGESILLGKATVDHVPPLAELKEGEVSRLLPAHGACNYKAGGSVRGGSPFGP